MFSIRAATCAVTVVVLSACGIDTSATGDEGAVNERDDGGESVAIADGAFALRPQRIVVAEERRDAGSDAAATISLTASATAPNANGDGATATLSWSLGAFTDAQCSLTDGHEDVDAILSTGMQRVTILTTTTFLLTCSDCARHDEAVSARIDVP